MKKIYVFVNSIISSKNGNVVEASNGKTEGPPFIRFEVSDREVLKYHIGKKCAITIEESE